MEASCTFDDLFVFTLGLISLCVVQIIVVVWIPAGAVNPTYCSIIFRGNHTFLN